MKKYTQEDSEKDYEKAESAFLDQLSLKWVLEKIRMSNKNILLCRY